MAREAVWAPTKDTVSNPYYIKGAPYRAKICPPLEPGQTLLISGRIWAYDTREPLPNTIIDIWHADSSGQYSGYEQHNPTERHTFYNRGRLITDNTGYYEYETIHPGHHEIAHDKLRPSHIHYLVWSSNYKTLNTQLYFKDDPNNETDHLIKESLIIDLRRVFRGGGFYEEGNFDIVLEPLPK
jgi:protocatechuate 3,4-dioxygenase beta subunit